MKLITKYRRIFNSDNIHWSKNTEINLFFLRTIQMHLNDVLKARGHLMLNEAYDVLGFSRTAEGAVIGWVYEEGNNFVDLGLSEYEGDGPDIPIVFNVNGNILNKAGEEP